MNLRRKDFGDVGDLAYGLAQSKGVEVASLAGELMVVPAQMAYLHIPAIELRNFVDGVFPNLATNRIADSASGFGHRYRAGHDLLLDVPSTFSSHGPWEGIRHAGHIVFTDFPTKAGIPIPGFSHSGLGQLLEQAGISHGWLQLSFFDTGVGIFAFADGASAVVQAMQGTLSMNFGTACQTFGMGGAEVGFAIATQNPLLLAGGLQNLLAGVVSTWKTFSVYVDPLDFLGAGGTSALLGFGVAYGVVGESLGDATLDAARSGTIGALFSVSSAFGFGALAGFVACRLGSALAQHHNASAQARLTVDEESYRLLVEALCAGNLRVRDLLDRTAPRLAMPDRVPVVNQRDLKIDDNAKTLSTKAKSLGSRARILATDAPIINSGWLALPDDPVELSAIYRSSFSRITR